LLFALFVVSCPSFDTGSRNVSGRSKLGVFRLHCVTR